MKKWIVAAAVGAVWLGSLYLAYGLGNLLATFMPGPLSGPARAAFSMLMLLPGSAQPCDVDDPMSCGFADVEGRVEVRCDAFAGDRPERAVLFAFGQSNSANSAQDRYVPIHDVVNFNPHDGKCYRAEDPLLGPDGTGGSVWGRVADELIRDGLYRDVMIVPIGIGGTELARWTPGADLHVRVERTAAMLARLGIRPTHVLWHQGESDAFADTPAEDYVEQFRALAAALPALGIDAPILPAVATRCELQGPQPTAERIRRAQRSLPERFANVLPGPDTDGIAGPLHRPDGCHFTHKGIDAHARLWVRAIREAGSSTRTAREAPFQSAPHMP